MIPEQSQSAATYDRDSDSRHVAVPMPGIPPRWRKVSRELWSNRTRSLLVVLSIAIGVFALGVIAGTREILDEQYLGSYFQANPADACLGISDFDESLIESVARLPQVEDVTAVFKLTLGVRVASGEQQNLVLMVLPDYDDVRIGILEPEAGAWPPPEGGIVFERSSLPVLGEQIGETIQVELPDGRLRELEIAGTVHDVSLTPARLAGMLYGYADFDTLESWGYSREFNELAFTVPADRANRQDIEAAVEAVSQKVEKGGNQVSWTQVQNIQESPIQNVLDSLLLILASLGILALLLSGFLVINTLSAILAQQIRQIGIMKAVGARTRQIMALYFAMALSFGVLALLLAVPLGVVGAYGLSIFASSLLNFDVFYSGIDPGALALQATIAILLPLLAATVPIVKGTRVTVREAISFYGLGRGHFGQGLLDRALSQTQRVFPFLPRPLLLSLRNTFRRKSRLVLTLLTLTLGGAIFVAVFSVRLSLFNTWDEVRRYDSFDNYIQLERNYRKEEIQRLAFQVPGVVAVETWGNAWAVRQRPDGSDSNRIQLLAPPAETQMLQPTLVAGRWLLDQDESAIVLNTSVLEEEPDVQIGDELTLRIGDKETPWTVVGIVQSLLADPTAYANYPYFAQLTGTTGRASFARIAIDPSDAANQKRVAGALQQQFESAGYQVDSTGTAVQFQETAEFQFDILTTFLVVMSILMALVGGMGLTGTMSINVLERTREIGVLRAIGASDGAVMQVILAEGVLIGLISWLLGALLGWPIGQVMSTQIGLAFVDTPLIYGYSVPGALLWLGVAVVIALVASFLPARNAATMTVHEVLSYE